MTNVIDAASDVAGESLRQCFTDDGIICGRHHFVDLWARDGLFAALGALAAGETEAAKNTIVSFIRFQRRDGLIPYRIFRSRNTLAKYSGKPAYLPVPRPNFRSYQSGSIVPDGGVLTVIAADAYYRKTKDTQFISRYYPALVRAVNWYRLQFQDLIREGYCCEWNDAVWKQGNTLYTNVLYVAALDTMARLANRLHDDTRTGLYDRHAKNLRHAVRQKFWNGRYFSDWVDHRRHDYFYSHGNMLALWFGLATPGEARRILRTAGEKCFCDFTLRESFPRYPFYLVPPHNYLMGIGDYHNGLLWLQPGIWYALNLAKFGFTGEAIRVFSKISRKLTHYKNVFEVYETDGRPVWRSWYKAEHPFAWSSGLFLLARDYITGGQGASYSIV